MFDRLSLRARLLLGVFVISAIGLVAADAATYASLRSFLLDRVDKTLELGHAQVEHIAFPHEGGPGQGQGQGPSGQQPPRGSGPPAEGIDWYQVRTLTGDVLASGFLVGGGSAPSLPDSIRLPSSGSGNDGERATYFTVSSKSGSTSYRVRASIEPQEPNRVFIISVAPRRASHPAQAAPDRARGDDRRAPGVRPRALGRSASACGLCARSRRRRRSLRRLSRRVERAEPKTEVGRLGLSLNAMLAQIESAFKARQASEERLRRSDQKLRRFVADASHELRTPLAAVRAYAELFSRGAASRPADLERSMSGITREAERMSLLVDASPARAARRAGRSTATVELAGSSAKLSMRHASSTPIERSTSMSSRRR
jgi:two-component system OmpR family sensor kinase